MTESFAPAFFERVAAAVGVGVLVTDIDGRLVAVSDAYAELFDADPSTIVGTPLWRIDTAFDPEQFAEWWETVGESGTQRAEATHEVVGRAVPVTTVTTRRTVDGDAYQFVAVTDRRGDERREAAIASRNDHLDAFAAVVTDDLRAPIDAAQNCLDRLEADVDECEAIRPLDGALDRMESLVDDFHARARGDGTLTDPDPVPVGEVATAAWVTVDARGATLDRAVADHQLRADPTQLQQLFEHLFRNSVEHGSTGPQQGAADSVEHGSTPTDDEVATAVTITVGALEDGFYVADDGRGISAGRRERVFEAGVSSDVDGSGIGLRIVAEIADTHGWTVTLTESAAGGARFEFRAGDPETRERAP